MLTHIATPYAVPAVSSATCTAISITMLIAHCQSGGTEVLSYATRVLFVYNIAIMISLVVYTGECAKACIFYRHSNRKLLISWVRLIVYLWLAVPVATILSPIEFVAASIAGSNRSYFASLVGCFVFQLALCVFGYRAFRMLLACNPLYSYVTIYGSIRLSLSLVATLVAVYVVSSGIVRACALRFVSDGDFVANAASIVFASVSIPMTYCLVRTWISLLNFSPDDTQSRYCVVCGYTLLSGSKVCPECGTVPEPVTL